MSVRSRAGKFASSLLSAFAAIACDYPAAREPLAEPSRMEFEATVYPLLLRDCGFYACHGTPERFFQVFGPGRERLSEASDSYAPATRAELDLTYARARSMLRGPKGVRSAPLLRKPLDRSAGGAGHRGEDPWQQNVYASPQDPGYRVLLEWALSMQDELEAEP